MIAFSGAPLSPGEGIRGTAGLMTGRSGCRRASVGKQGNRAHIPSIIPNRVMWFRCIRSREGPCMHRLPERMARNHVIRSGYGADKHNCMQSENAP